MRTDAFGATVKGLPLAIEAEERSFVLLAAVGAIVTRDFGHACPAMLRPGSFEQEWLMAGSRSVSSDTEAFHSSDQDPPIKAPVGSILGGEFGSGFVLTLFKFSASGTPT